MWIYVQRTGRLYRKGKLVGQGYSGHGSDGKNNPVRQSVPNVGPIPCGLWRVHGQPYASSDHGPFVLALQPLEGTQTYGRSGFLIRGDSTKEPGEASMGDVILSKALREAIWRSEDLIVHVVREAVPEYPEIDGGISV